jgi:hypothetical protein
MLRGRQRFQVEAQKSCVHSQSATTLHPLSLQASYYARSSVQNPFRIFKAHVSRILLTIIGLHQHGFMAQHGIQELHLLATHILQDASTSTSQHQHGESL